MTTLFGLPEEVKFCTRCVMSNQRPNTCNEYAHHISTPKATIRFDDEGVCDACRATERKQNTDWQQRERELIQLCKKYRRDDGYWDCLVPGSGGKDSFVAAYQLKYKYGMNPLTITWAPHIYTDWGWHNMEAWNHAGLDNILYTPSGKTHRVLTRLALDNLFHPFQPFILGQKSLAPKIAAQMKIPLVFYGENEAEYGNPVAEVERATRDWHYFNNPQECFISGVAVAELMDRYELSESDLAWYLPANAVALEREGIEVHYLGYYLHWHPQGSYYFAVEKSDPFRKWQAAPERTEGTYSKYNSIDDKMDDLHYWTTYVKFGVGRATYDASQEIRNGEIEREEGVALVRRYDGEYPTRFETEVLNYLSPDGFERLDRDQLWRLAAKFRSPHLWEPDGDCLWKLRHTVFATEKVLV